MALFTATPSRCGTIIFEMRSSDGAGSSCSGSAIPPWIPRWTRYWGRLQKQPESGSDPLPSQQGSQQNANTPPLHPLLMERGPGGEAAIAYPSTAFVTDG